MRRTPGAARGAMVCLQTWVRKNMSWWWCSIRTLLYLAFKHDSLFLRFSFCLHPRWPALRAGQRGRWPCSPALSCIFRCLSIPVSFCSLFLTVFIDCAVQRSFRRRKRISIALDSYIYRSRKNEEKPPWYNISLQRTLYYVAIRSRLMFILITFFTPGTLLV